MRKTVAIVGAVVAAGVFVGFLMSADDDNCEAGCKTAYDQCMKNPDPTIQDNCQFQYDNCINQCYNQPSN